jgi:hypothetical protein
MALVTGNVLGNLSGRLGNLSARTVNGKTILAARPSSFNASQDPSVLEVRKKFAVTSNFAKYVLSLAVLSSVWEKVKEAGNSLFNTVFKYNFQYSTVEKPTANNIITPGGFSLPVSNASVAADSITAQIPALNTETVIAASEVDASIAAVVVYSNPTNPEDEATKIFTLSKDVAGFNFGSTYNLNIPLNTLQQNVAAKYQDSVLLLAVVTKDAAGKVVQYSATYSKTSV